MLLKILILLAIITLPSINSYAETNYSSKEHSEKSATQIAELVGSNNENRDEFGFSVSIFNDIAVVGAPNYNHSGLSSGSGAAYVYEYINNQWVQTAILYPSDGNDNIRFGHSVSINNNRIVIGTYTGEAAYIFQLVAGLSWLQTHKLTAPDGVDGDRFGSTVDINENKQVFVSSIWNNDNGLHSGSVYVFDGNNGYQYSAKITAPDGQASDWFGSSISASGENVLISSIGDDDNGEASGSVYFYKQTQNNWSLTYKILPFDGSAGDIFGDSVSLTSNRILIGAPGQDTYGENSGSAYLYYFDTNVWNVITQIFPNYGSSYDYFGDSVSLYQNYFLIGASGSSVVASNAGTAYLFEHTGTYTRVEIERIDPVFTGTYKTNRYFGNAVSLHGARAIIGSFQGSVSSNSFDSHTGVANVFSLDHIDLLFSDGFE